MSVPISARMTCADTVLTPGIVIKRAMASRDGVSSSSIRASKSAMCRSKSSTRRHLEWRCPMKTLHRRCAGLDVHSDSVMCGSWPEGRGLTARSRIPRMLWPRGEIAPSRPAGHRSTGCRRAITWMAHEKRAPPRDSRGRAVPNRESRHHIVVAAIGGFKTVNGT